MTIKTAFKLLKTSSDLHLGVALLLAVPVIYHQGLPTAKLVARSFL